MLVREVRLRIIPLGPAPNNIRPYLVAFNNLAEADVGNSAVDYDPIAADVESFQVSYVMNRGPPPPAVPVPLDGAGGDWVLGNATGDALALPTAGGVRPDFYSLDYTDVARYSSDVANVRAVTFDLSVRSRREERRSAFPQPRLANDPTAAAPTDGYFHVSVGTTVRTPNLLSRATFAPPLVGTNPNFWGG
jgi:type IV pilus assembly protein PilW